MYLDIVIIFSLVIIILTCLVVYTSFRFVIKHLKEEEAILAKEKSISEKIDAKA